MKKVILLMSVLLCISLISYAGNGRIYKGDSTAYSDIVYTVSGSKVYKGNSTAYSDIVYTTE